MAMFLELDEVIRDPISPWVGISLIILIVVALVIGIALAKSGKL
jgi:hypothetical protein